MNNIYKRTLLPFLIGGCFAVHSQISNEGIISVTENTTVVFSEDFTNKTTAMLSNNGTIHLKQNLINNGGFTFDNLLSNEAITNFSGTAIQHISGSQLLEIPRLVLSNSSGFELLSDISVSKQANFTNGIINNRDFGGSITFEPNVALSNVSNQSHVNGSVIKTGADDFIFPIGANGYIRDINISGVTDAATVFSAQYMLQNSNAIYAHNQKETTILFIDNTEYWESNKVQGSSTMAVTLSWNMATTPSEIWSSPEDIHIVQWNIAQSKWVDLGGTVDIANLTVTTTKPVTDDGIFTLATIADQQDTDGDGVPDIVEENSDPATDPNNPNDFTDTDGDGVPDYVEENGNPATDPNNPNDFTDSDGDGVPDYAEENNEPPTNPNDATDFTDSDGDGVPDYAEENGDPATDPNNPNDFTDSNGDGIPDYKEDRNDLSNISIKNDLVSKSNISGFFKIINIEEFPNNTVKIFNRNGLNVFSIDGYDNQSNVFRGISNAKKTINKTKGLPTGVYFYIIKYANEKNSRTKSGYLYITE